MLIHLLAAETTTQTGGSLLGLALPLLMLVGFYFLLIRPQRNRQRAQQALLAQLEVGDDILTSGGMFGTIVDIDDEEGVLTVEIAPNTNVKMLRQGVAQRYVEDDEVVDEDDASYDDDDDEATEEADRTP